MTPPDVFAEDAQRQADELRAILDQLIGFVRRFVVVSDHQAATIALWIVHSHTIEAFDCTPYLQIWSATKRSGKTRLLEVLEQLVANPWFTGRTSVAALMRKVDAECPTLLLDESDAAFGGDADYSEALRGCLNTGYRSSGNYTVCAGQGAKLEARSFSTFCAKAIAGIGKLPDTIADRSVEIKLIRRLSDEPCERWRAREGSQQAAPLRDALTSLPVRALDALRVARPETPPSLSDRQSDVWEPLLAIADLARGEWPLRARQAAVSLAGMAEDADITVELLRDVQIILAEYSSAKDVIPSAYLIEQLVANDARPWATWRKGERPITPRGLARLLSPLAIVVGEFWTDGANVRGYRRDAFNDAIARYLPSQVRKCENPNKTGPETDFSMCEDAPPTRTCKSEETPITTGVLAHTHIDPRETGIGDIRRGAEWVPASTKRGDDGLF